MTEQQIVETLAVKVMGWEKRQGGMGEYWFAPDEPSNLPVLRWNPFQNIADAWVLVDKIGPFEYRKLPIRIGGGYQHITEFFYHEHWYSGEGKTVQEAICQAALKAAT